MKKTILEMEEYSLENHIAIMDKKTITSIMSFIKKNNVKSVLEIGSGIGYSAILMASVDPSVNVTTIEANEDLYMDSLKNIKKVGFDKKINVVYHDALELNLPEETSYDLIILDAARGKYIKYFEKYEHFLIDNGSFITIRVNYQNKVGKSKNVEDENLKCLLEKIEKYVEFLKDNKNYETKFYDIDEGLAISSKVKKAWYNYHVFFIWQTIYNIVRLNPLLSNW